MIPNLGQDAGVAIDGKTSRRTDRVDATPLPLVSAFAAGAGLVLGRRATARKSNEKTAITELLSTLSVEQNASYEQLEHFIASAALLGG